MCQTGKRSPRAHIPSRPEDMVVSSIETDGCSGANNYIKYLEHVQCVISIRHYPRGSLSIVLESPMGTR